MDPCKSTIDNVWDILKNKYGIECISNIFNELPSSEKVFFTYNLLREEGLLPEFFKKSTKSKKKAIEFRSLGNKAFCLKKDVEALKHYSKSVSVSPPDSEELSLAYANRSAVLFKLGKYQSSVMDIDRALERNYPDSLKYKLLERKGKCFLETGRCDIAKELFMDSLSYLILSDTTNDQRLHIEKALNQLIEECNNCTKEIVEPYKINFPLPPLLSSNRLIPNASDKIRIDYSFEMGRHLIASKDIEPGEILAIEKPYASILLPEFYHTHCSNCFIRNEAMIPCDNCSTIMFCNETCREECLKKHHATECDILPLLVLLEKDIGKIELLAIRTLIIATNQGNLLNDLYCDPVFGKPLPYPMPSELHDISEQYISEDYKSVHMLEENYVKRSLTDLFLRSVTAAIMTHVLRYSTFFKNVESDFLPYSELNEIEQFTSSLLLKYLCIILCNAHEISEVIAECPARKLEIGAALYPLLSLINHSCDPNVVRHSYHDNVVLRSIQPIEMNQQLLDSYGYHYAVHSVQERQSQLKIQYFFTCNCEPCKFDWPLYKDLPSENPIYISKKIDLKKIKESSLNFNKILSKMINAKCNDVLQTLCQHLSLLHKSIKRPWKDYSACQEAIKECLVHQANHYDSTVNVIL